MTIDTIRFSTTDIDGISNIVKNIGNNKLQYWPLSWTLVVKPDQTDDFYDPTIGWINRNCKGKWELQKVFGKHSSGSSIDATYCNIYAFEDKNEAILFKLSF